MMIRLRDEEFSIECGMLDVTSLHRPDTSWRVVDAQGHEHRWYVAGLPAGGYAPDKKHETPTLVDVFDGWGYYEDGERYAISHQECRQCGEHIKPAFTADTSREFIPGLRRFFINGKPVTKEDFEWRWATATARQVEHGA